jgi:hypothetical protein
MHAIIARFPSHRLLQVIVVLLCASTVIMACPSKDGYTAPTESTARAECLEGQHLADGVCVAGTADE